MRLGDCKAHVWPPSDGITRGAHGPVVAIKGATESKICFGGALLESGEWTTRGILEFVPGQDHLLSRAIFEKLRQIEPDSNSTEAVLVINDELLPVRVSVDVINNDDIVVVATYGNHRVAQVILSRSAAVILEFEFWTPQQ